MKIKVTLHRMALCSIPGVLKLQPYALSRVLSLAHWITLLFRLVKPVKTLTAAVQLSSFIFTSRFHSTYIHSVCLPASLLPVRMNACCCTYSSCSKVNYNNHASLWGYFCSSDLYVSYNMTNTNIFLLYIQYL